MNIFETIQRIVEKETGLTCMYEQENIEDNQVMVSIREIEKTGCENKYQVFGNFMIKTGRTLGWQVLTKILELPITGMRASATLSEVGDGFALMSVEFSIVLELEEGRKQFIQNIAYA